MTRGAPAQIFRMDKRINKLSPQFKVKAIYAIQKGEGTNTHDPLYLSILF